MTFQNSQLFYHFVLFLTTLERFLFQLPIFPEFIAQIEKCLLAASSYQFPAFFLQINHVCVCHIGKINPGDLRCVAERKELPVNRLAADDDDIHICQMFFLFQLVNPHQRLLDTVADLCPLYAQSLLFCQNQVDSAIQRSLSREGQKRFLAHHDDFSHRVLPE